MPLARFRTAALAALRQSHLGADDGSTWRREALHLRAAVRDAWFHLEARLEARAWALARRFSPRLRWSLYELLASDGSGRLAQLADAAPGALVFSVMHALMADARGREAARAFWTDVIAGRPLRQSLTPLLEDWALLASRMKLDGAARPLEPLAHVSLSERRKRLLHQRTLLRRTRAGLDGRLLWRPAPHAFVPEDIPTTLEAQARWLRTLQRFSSHLSGEPAAPRKVQDAFMGWLSAHAAQPLPYGWTPRALFHGVLTHRAVLPRRLSPERLMEKLDAWEHEA
jgi:hypothetical protein